MIKYHQKQSTKIDGLPSRIFSTIRCSVQMQIDMTQWFMFHINDKSMLRNPNSYQSHWITCHIFSVSRLVRNIKNYDLRPKDRNLFTHKNDINQCDRLLNSYHVIPQCKSLQIKHYTVNARKWFWFLLQKYDGTKCLEVIFISITCEAIFHHNRQVSIASC